MTLLSHANRRCALDDNVEIRRILLEIEIETGL
jgi:hypothetical protein